VQDRYISASSTAQNVTAALFSVRQRNRPNPTVLNLVAVIPAHFAEGVGDSASIKKLALPFLSMALRIKAASPIPSIHER
jgi:hypothetical protein